MAKRRIIKKMEINFRFPLSDGYSAYISDGYSRVADEDHGAPHHKTMYAYGRDGEVFLGEFYTTPALIHGITNKNDRMAECKARAKEQFKDFREKRCLR